MSELNAFKHFAKGLDKLQIGSGKKAVVYTRVSTKEQAENNASLVTQRKHCDRFAEKKCLDIVEYFGGTYESAKSDERKEFNKMLKYVKARNISYIIVYSYDRFTRTGISGANIADELLKKHQIITLSVTQDLDPTTSSGSMMQKMHFLFSQWDNEERRKKSVVGMQEKLRKGEWMGVVPRGYINLNPGKGKQQKIVLTAEGKIMRKAWYWRLNDNLSYEQISERLMKLGVNMPYKKLSDMFRNPFYCGLITSNHIPGEVIRGKHEPMVSKELFLKVEKTLYGNGGYNFDDDKLPLKKFVYSYEYNTPLTGYVKSKAKKSGNGGVLYFYYYKTNLPKSKENRNAGVLHQKFLDLIGNYQVSDKKLIAPLKMTMHRVFIEWNKEQLEQTEKIKQELSKLQRQAERIEERFVFEDISKEQYLKFKPKLDKQIHELSETIQKSGFNLSNLEKSIEIALHYALNLPPLWERGNVEVKKALQEMLFPDGIWYDFKNDCYRTKKVNTVFSCIPYLVGSTAENKSGTIPNIENLSRSVPWVGIEPTLP